jgi:hypothetical protein
MNLRMYAEFNGLGGRPERCSLAKNLAAVQLQER